MYYRCELMVNGLLYRVTDDLKNWDEIKVSFKRNDYDGVVRSFSSKFEFVGSARSLLLKQYEDNYLDAAASVVISTRNNSWLYTERFNCALNFSTLVDDGNTLSINAIDNSVASLIKAKKGTQYEYPVEELKDSKSLLYDGLELSCNAEWIITGYPRGGEYEGAIYVPFNDSTKPSPITIYVTKSDALIKRNVLFNDVSDTSPLSVDTDGNITDAPSSNKSFIEAVDRAVSVTLDISANFSISHLDTNGKVILARSEGKKLVYIHESSNIQGSLNKIFEFKGTVNLNKGDALFFLFRSDRADNELNAFEDRVKIHAEWKDRINPVEIDVIKPDILLNRLLKSINNEKDGLTGVIEGGNERLDKCMMLAAEAARKIPGAKVYTSFTKFSNWMSYMFGYAYDINGNTITFRHRSRYFSDEIVKRIDNYSYYEFKVNASLVYSRMRIGFDKQDYDTVNGKDEFRFTNEYTTGVTMTDNGIEMISPYRADAYGIEFLADKIGEDTTDNESDTDLFIVGIKDDSSGIKYILNRDYSLSGVLSPGTMFNAMYSPTSMIIANEGFIGTSIENLTFASSDGNSEVVINGNAENRNISISNQMFTAAEISIETSDVELPEDLAGIVELEHQGELIHGYYSNVDYSYGRLESSKITLIVKKR